MTDAPAPQPLPPTPPQPAARPSAVAGTKPITAADDDDNILRHLGLPFYFRHTPTRQVSRSMFWLTALAIAAIVLINLILMPYSPGTMLYAVRKSLFGSGYSTFEEGYKSLYSLLTVLGLILSSIIAPIVATMSFVNERSSGTLEFLRLAPLSNLSIVIGKTIPPVYPLHLAAAALYTLGIGFGLLASYDPDQLALITLAAILLTITCHAAGAFCATMSVMVKGVAAVIVLGAIGFCFAVIPIAMWEGDRFSFLAYLSPWALLEGFIWDNNNYRGWGRPRISYELSSEFFGIAWAAKYYALMLHASATAFFLWAATRKLDTSENTALPKFGWFLVASLITVTAFGAMHNTFIWRWGGGGPPGLRNGWIHAGMVFVAAGIPYMILLLLDHPHRRELVLTEECERLAGRATLKPGTLHRLRHALFGLMLTLGFAAAATFAFSQGYTTDNQFKLILLIGGLFAVLAFLAAVAIEIAAIGFIAPWSRVAMAVLLIIALSIGVLAPLIHGVVAWERFTSATTASVYFYTLKEREADEAKNKTVLNEQQLQQRRWERQWYGNERNDPAAQIYIGGVQSKAAAMALRDKYSNDVLSFLLAYHASTFACYLGLWAGIIGGLFFWRRIKYRALEDEARRAVFRNPPVLKSAAPAAPAAVATPEEIGKPAAG